MKNNSEGRTIKEDWAAIGSRKLLEGGISFENLVRKGGNADGMLSFLREIWKIKIDKRYKIEESYILEMLEYRPPNIRKSGVKILTELCKIKLEKGYEIDDSPFGK